MLETYAKGKWENSPYDFGYDKKELLVMTSAGVRSPKALEEETVNVMAALEAESEYLDSLAPGAEQPDIEVEIDDSIFTRHTEPMKKARVNEILQLIELGNDLDPMERQQVQDKVTDFADIFALSVGEVEHIPGAVHKLDVPEGAKFSTKIGQ